jgi:hypothetical protein
MELNLNISWFHVAYEEVKSILKNQCSIIYNEIHVVSYDSVKVRDSD